MKFYWRQFFQGYVTNTRAIPRVFVALPLLGMAFSAHAMTIEGLPDGDVFQSLIADPKEPRYMVSFLSADSDSMDTTVGAIAYGERFGIVRWSGGAFADGLQISIAAGLFAQFDMQAPSYDLINADYTVGVPLTYRNGRFSLRMRTYHQSSHLGDEYLIRNNPERVNLSYESFETLLSYDLGVWRVYGGGEYLFGREPNELKRSILHAGAEYRHPTAVLRVSDLGAAYFIAGLDGKSFEEHDWQPGWSLKSGLEFHSGRDTARTGRFWRLLFHAYTGPSQYGQFYTEDVNYWGAGISWSL